MVPACPVKRRTLLAGAGASLLAAPAVHAQAKSGVALVLGNSKYQWEAPLPNVRRDAPDIARRFQELGLKTDLVQDAGRQAMQQAAERFAAASKGADFSAFYFAGHGASWQRGTYLVPVDADLGTPNIVESLLPVRVFRDATSGAPHRLILLDNCRNNPADGWRQKEDEDRASSRRPQAGTQNDDPPDTIVLFSTVPGRAAMDGPAGQNSPFAAAILRQLSAPPVDLPGLPTRLRRDLLIATGGRQFLWDRNNYQQTYTIAGPRDSRAPQSPAAGQVVEIPNAYAFAAQNGLPMPPGVVAVRSAGSRDAAKVGAYRYGGYSQDPSLLVVISVEDGQYADLLLGYRDNKQQRTKWRVQRGTLSGETLDFINPDGGLRTTFSWSDANSGKLSMVPQGGGNSRIVNATFNRID